MSSYLKKYCSILGIKLVYTNNKYTVLSSGYNKDIPCIRVHNYFKECPEEIAKAIIGYYNEFYNNEQYLNIVKEYTEEKLGNNEYIIKPPSEKYKRLITKNKKSIYKELNIKKIYKKDQKGNVVKIKTNESINKNQDNYLELDIIVDYSI